MVVTLRDKPGLKTVCVRVRAITSWKVASNNQRITFDLVNICQLDSGGKLVEEWVRTDNRSIFRQLGVSQD